MTQSAPRVSIIIVSYNPGALVLGCLSSIPAGAGDLPHEVIVVDNASTDGTPERVRERFPSARLIPNPDNRGFAAACNQGLKLAAGDYALLLNPDAVLHPGALVQMAEFMDGSPDAGLIGARVRDARGRVALTAYQSFSAGILLWQYLGLDRLLPYVVFGRYRWACEHAVEPFAVASVHGSCLMARRALWESMGGLDEGFFLFIEETDWCERAREAGWRVFYVPGAQATHRESSTVSRYPLIKIRYYHLSPLYYFRKRRQTASVLMLKLGFSVEIMLKSLLRIGQAGLGRRVDLSMFLAAYRDVLGEVWRY